MASSEPHNARLSGMKQDLAYFKNDFNSSLSCFKQKTLTQNSIVLIVDWIRQRVISKKKKKKKKYSITDVVNENIMSIKDSIIDAFKEENMKLQSMVEQHEEKFLRIKIAK